MGSSVWFAGGLDGGPSRYAPINSAVELDENGDTLQTIDLPIPDHQFLAASWIGDIDGQITILGTVCILPDESPLCPDRHPDSVAGLFQLNGDGAVEFTALPDLVVDGDTNQPTRRFRAIGALGSSVYVEFTSQPRSRGLQSAGASIDLFRVDVATGEVVAIQSPTDGLERSDIAGLVDFRGVCLSGNTLYSLSYSIADDTNTIDRLRLRSASGLPGEPTAWVDEMDIALDSSFPTRGPALECTDSDVFVDSVSATLFMRIVRDIEPISPEIVDLTGHAVHAQVKADGLLVTVLRGPETDGLEEAVVWEYRPSEGWSERGRGPGLARVVEAGTQLLDIDPAMSNAADQGATLVRPYDA